MPRGRPRLSAEYHKLVGNYRPSVHGPLATSPQPEPELSPADQAIRDERERWSCAFSTGYDFFVETGCDDRAESFVGEMRAAWRRLGDTFLAERGWKGFNVDTPFALWAFGSPSQARKRKGDLETLRRQHEPIWPHD
jgi:hypothetical protein